MPIKARIDMLSTGIRTPVGVKVIGRDLAEMEKVAREVEKALKTVEGTASAYAERVVGGYYLEIIPDRDRLARYGLMVSDVQDVVGTALGAEPITTTVEGPRTLHGRHPLSPRSALRPAIHRQGRAWSPCQTAAGPCRWARWPTSGSPRAPPASAPRTRSSPPTSSSTSATATSAATSPPRRRRWPQQVQLPAGTYLVWSGQFEYLQRAEARLQVVVPVTLMIIFLLLYLNFRRLTETLIVMLSLPFALVGGLWLLWWLGFNMSVAVAVGFIALAGVAAETGVVMLIYLDHAVEEIRARCAAEGRPYTRADLYQAIMVGAVERVRPKMMTVVAIMGGLLPIMWSTGTGSEVMQRIAVPMIGGMVSSTLLTLIVIPAIYAVIKGWNLPATSVLRSRPLAAAVHP